jgi:hypothetical protein
MNRPLFRPPDFWKSAVMTLPDSSFFELLRSIFGNIKTPFNKQRLMADLEVLLSREEIQKTIASYIDEGDARIIAAVAVLGEPVPGELESFFAGELSYAVLHDILLNLEERFILYRFREDGQSRLALNPALEPVLAPRAAERSLLFPSVPPGAAESAESGEAPASPAPRPVADDRLLGGILAFVAGESRFFKNEGGLRKKIAGAGERVFPGFDLESLVGGLRLLGLLRPEGEGLVPDERRLRAFAELSPRERMEYWAAGIYCLLHEEGGTGAAAGHLLRGRVRSLAALIHRLLDLVEPGRWYPPGTLRRYAGILEQEGWNSEPGGSLRFDRLTAVMETLGLLASPVPDYLAAGSALGGEGRAGVNPPAETPPLAMDSPFSCILYPGIAFADILSLASFLMIRETGVVVRFELTRESAVRGFDRGLDAAGMIALLERLSRKPADETLVWSLKDWEKRRAEVCLRRGIVLVLSEDRRYLAEAEPVAELIREILAPGVYLLSGSDTEAAAEALEKAGVDIISRGGGEIRGGNDSGTAAAMAGVPELFPSLRGEASFPGAAFPMPAVSAPDAEREALKTRFRGALEKMSLSKVERDELASRIDRRLVLNESQLEGVSIRYEKLEARLLDYVGKAAIAKQAISSKSLVEVIWPQGSLQVTGIPEALEKTGGESVLVLRPLSPEPEEPARSPGDPYRIPGNSIRIPGDSIRIPLGKISLLRRIKKSIFGE